MNFLPLIVMNGILFVVTVLLVIAERLLVNYGQCKITVKQEQEDKEFVVEGGNYLITDLAANKINVSSSCGGKVTCGYCKIKVLNGGGEILPTEEIFMSRQEKHDNMRLACQVKVRNDIEIYIPDFITTVRSIVKNRTYDPKLKWNFEISNQVKQQIEEKKKSKLEVKKEEEILSGIIGEYKDRPGTLVPVLQRINSVFNYLPESALRHTAEKLDISFSSVFRTATFYNAFSLKPRGKNVITVCLGTACYVKGAGDIVEAFESELGVKLGQTTEDMFFTLEAVRCIGCCGLAPVLKVNEDVHGLMTRKKVAGLIKQYRGV